MDKPLTIIISDLHVGGGPNDPGDDHVYDTNQFVRFLESLCADKAGQEGNIELIINGDFLEFGQVRPEVYALASALYWCSQSESLQKLEAIVQGHPDFFEALKTFQEPGNRVTLAAGNHDVDLYWPGVQDRLRDVGGPMLFELGHATYTRYDGRLLIGHGHMYDPANRFEHWDNPILSEPSGDDRLEMCPGTLFMTKFVNWLERVYPFADNIKPVTALGRVLWKESKLGLLSVAWVLFAFSARHPISSLGTSEPPRDIGDIIRHTFDLDAAFQEKLVELYRHVHDRDVPIATVRQTIGTDEGLEGFIRDLIGKVSPEHWLPVFDRPVPETLAIDSDETETLSILSSGIKDEKQLLRETARGFFLEGHEVVVFGHTHQPDELDEDGKRYVNPGSWTRYLQMEKLNKVTLHDLKNEQDFPYQLNWVRVEPVSTGALKAELRCFEQKDGDRFKV